MRVISLGWGIQSFTLAAMAALGELIPVDAAVHADTTHEGAATYEFVARWTQWLEKHGINVVTVRDKFPQVGTNRPGGKIFIPAFTISENEKKGGQLRRQCTQRWKIAPIRRWLQANRNGRPVDMLLGISLDEALRMRDSDVKYITNCYPLIDLRMTRLDCQNWLGRHGLEVPPKSACIFCPYQNTSRWRELKAHGNGDWQKAVEVDQAIRKVRPPHDLYVHPARIPLVDVDMRSAEDHGQLNLWSEECSGICGV